MGKVSEKWIGQKRVNRYGSEMILEKFNNSEDILVRFIDTGNLVKTSIKRFKIGDVRNPFHKSVLGIGYIGEGQRKTKINGVQTKQYATWRNMLERCYNPKVKEKHPTYKDCTVDPEWHNFSTFTKWFDNNYYEIEGEKMNLDKDILVKGNKIYSPETCVFVPQSINVLFVNHYERRGECPIGVYKHRDGFRAEININGEKVKIGTYKTEKEAFSWYKDIKESVIKIAANEHKGIIPKKLYDAMHSYEVEITD
jgi:hypothetical protein